MKTLKSELTWSFSRDRLFQDCRRAYFYHYYASWGGWNVNAEEFSRKAYILKNIRNIDAWIGDIVHQIIKWVLENKKADTASLFAKGRDVSYEEACGKAKHLLMKTWEQSRSQMWKENVKQNLNLLEHYYKREPNREELTAKLQKVTTSLRSFYDSGLLEIFNNIGQDKFLKLDELDSFEFDGVKVFAIPDFAVKNDKFTLYDWKTGKPSDKDVFQLSCYVLYAMDKWGLAPEQIAIVPVYLAEEKTAVSPIKAIDIDKVKEHIRGSIDEMKSVLLDIDENKADISRCPKTDTSWRCKNCKFQEICV